MYVRYSTKSGIDEALTISYAHRVVSQPSSLQIHIITRVCRQMHRSDKPPLLVFVGLCRSRSANPAVHKRVAEATPAAAAMPYSHPPTGGAFHCFSDTSADR